MIAFWHCVFVLLFSVSLVVGDGGIMKFENHLVGESFFLRVGMYNKHDAPATSAQNNNSFIKVDLDFKIDPPSNKKHSITSVLFQADQGWRVGYYLDNRLSLCCSQELIKATNCMPHHAIINTTNVNTKTFRLMNGIFENSHAERRTTLNVLETGMYYLYVINCNAFDHDERISVDGIVSFHNPYGYMPGETYPFLPFYGVVALVYLLLGVVWFGMSLRHWRKLLAIQNWMAAVIFLGMAESAALYFKDMKFNRVGVQHEGGVVFSIFMSTLKRTVSRVLVLVVAMGYGVVKPTLGTTRYKVTLLGMLYFTFFFCVTMTQVNQRTVMPSFAATVFLVVPVALLDTAFYWWSFLSLMRTLAQLKARRQVVKLAMYQWLFYTLAVSALVSAIVVVYRAVQHWMRVGSIGDPDKHWQTAWRWDAFWDILYLVILIVLVMLWRPTHNNTRYAYADVRALSANDAEKRRTSDDEQHDDNHILLRHVATPNEHEEPFVLHTKDVNINSKRN